MPNDRRYKLQRWRRKAARQLKSEPVCRYCRRAGLLNDGTLKPDGTVQDNPNARGLVADHIVPHRGNDVRFWTGDLQTLCRPHHNGTKQIEERRGFTVEVDASGWPVDPKHPGNRQKPAISADKLAELDRKLR